MMISTKGRYALRVMLDLAQNQEERFVSLKEISKRQDISMKYLEMIVSILNKGHLIQSQRGKDGGYRLSKRAEQYTVASILKLTEGTLAPVACIDCMKPQCGRADKCLTLPMWKQLDRLIHEYLEGITLQDLLSEATEE